jgi:hypothetical protein
MSITPNKSHGLSPLKQDDYKHIPSDSLTVRQQFNESRFKSSAVSESGAISIAQITKDTFNDGLKKGYVPEGTKFEDLAKDDRLATQFQKAYMDDLLTRKWNKGTEKVKRAKALAAYNMGPTRLVNILNEMKADGINITSDIDWVDKLPEYHRNRKTNEPIYESKHYVKNIMLGGDEEYEEEFDRLYKKRFQSVTKLTKEQMAGLSPLRENGKLATTSEELAERSGYNLRETRVEEAKVDVSAGAFSETIDNLVDYWSQEEGEGKLHSRLKGEEIRKHKPYVSKSRWSKTPEEQAEDYDYERGYSRPYLDTEETARKVVDRLMNTKILRVENEDDVRNMFDFIRKMNNDELDKNDPNVIWRMAAYMRMVPDTSSYVKGSHTVSPEMRLSVPGASGPQYDYEQASGEELFRRLKATVAHELGHITLGSGTEPKEDTTIELDRLYQGEGHGDIGTTWGDIDTGGMLYDEYYGAEVGAMSTKDANIIKDLMESSATAKNMGVNYDKMSKTDKHNLSFKEAYADMQAFRSDALDRGIYDWRTEDLDRETLQKYIDSYEGKTMPFTVRRFLQKFTVQPHSEEYYPEDYNEDAKYDNIIYMNNVIARGDKEGGQNIGGGIATQMNPDDYRAA